MLTEEQRAFIAHDMAGIAWAHVTGWKDAGKLQGDLTAKEFMDRLELTFREVLDVPSTAQCDPTHESKGDSNGR